MYVSDILSIYLVFRLNTKSPQSVIIYFQNLSTHCNKHSFLEKADGFKWSNMFLPLTFQL